MLTLVDDTGGEVVAYVGARPVLVDVDPHTLNASIEAVEQAITARTRAMIAVHIAGLPSGIEQLAPFLRDRGIALVEDAAELLQAGADKVAVNSAAVARPDLLDELVV